MSIPHIVSLDVENPRDQARILSLQRKAYLLEEALIGFPIPRLQDTPEALTSSGEIFVGVVRGRTLVGLLAFSAEEEGLDICRVAVDPRHFRQGIASELITFLLAAVPEAPRLRVTAAARNLPAVRLYEKMGFQVSETFEPIAGLPMYRMVLSRQP